MRLPVSTTVYFRWQKVILYLESMEVVSASYLAKLYKASLAVHAASDQSRWLDGSLSGKRMVDVTIAVGKIGLADIL